MFDEFKSAFQRPNNGHIQLIIINVVVFVTLILLSLLSKIFGLTSVFQIFDNQFVLTSNLSEFITRPWTVITYAFAHSRSDIFHIIFNMLGLYWFGRLFVEYLGSDKLIALYVLGALFGALTFLTIFNVNPGYFKIGLMVGASGAINAIIVAAATLIPNYTFHLLFFGPIKIKYIAFFFVVSSLVYINREVNVGGNLAHLGGALMGFVYLKQLQAGVNWGSWITVTLDWIGDLFRPKPKVKVTYRSEEKRTTTKSAAVKTSQEEIDAILDKISERGYESLSKDEKEKLFNASKK